MELKKISIKDIANNPGSKYIKFKEGFLIKILKKAARSNSPHRNIEFCIKLGTKINKNTNSSLTILHWIKFNRAIPISKLNTLVDLSAISWKEVEANIIGLRQGLGGGEIFTKFPIKIGNELGSIVGHIIGDGSIDKRYQQVFFSNSNKELLTEFSDDMEEVFGIKPRIWMQKRTIAFKQKTRWDRRLSTIEELKDGRNCGLFYPTICGILLNLIFSDFAIGVNKKVTSKIKSAPREFKSGLIRAFCDDEGSVGSKSIRLFQDRKDILADIKHLLNEFDISTKDIKMYIKRDKKRYYLDIHRKSNLIKFRDNIGLTSTKKSNKLRDACIIKNRKNSR